jgi:hypothetical protein
MRVRKRYNKHQSFNLGKKSIAVNENKVKKSKFDSSLNVCDATRVTIVNGKVSN